MKTSKIKAVNCPTCDKKIEWEKTPYHPFCSKRCKLIDLGEWAAEKYSIKGEKVNPQHLIQKEKKGQK